MVYVDDLLLIGDDDKIKTLLQQLEGQLQLKHMTKLEGHLLQLENHSTVNSTLQTGQSWENYYGCVHYDQTFNMQQKNSQEQYRNQMNTTSRT
eukprot:4025555-Amphidinium_carterae.1